MPSCENFDHCTFFERKLDVSPSLGIIFKKMYCQKDFENCARHMLRKKLIKGYYLPVEDPKIGKLEVFYEDLFPNNRKAASELIERLVL